MKQFFNNYIKNNVYAVALYNLLVVMALFMLCRIVFFFVNLEFFNCITFSQFITICQGGLLFDLSGVLYLNLLYLLMLIIPFRFRYQKNYLNTAKWIFYITNSIGLVMNCIDMVYFKFTNRRTTSTIFTEFSNEGNLGKVFAEGFVEYWYVVLFGIAIIFLLVKLYYSPTSLAQREEKHITYYTKNIVAMAIAIMFTIFGIRGGIGSFVRPITLSNANKYINKSLESAIVLNTPFCMIRTLGKKVYKNPKYFSPEELASIYEPIITPNPTAKFRNKNVVVIILESFSKEFVGELNKDLDNGKYKGYTPFLDSLIREGLTFEYTYANGRKSIDAMPSVLSSIPMFYEPYIATRYSTNKVSGIAGELNNKGYYTAFFHGAPNGSMGFEAYANVTGFNDYYGKDEYANDADYDGYWAIWDEEFLQFYSHKMSSFKQPFMTAVFTATSHHPFQIPKRYVKKYPEEGGHPLHKCIRYSDNALKHFFETSSKEAWFQNTLFVITADHTNALTRKEYLNDAGFFKVPILFYTPNGELKGRRQEIAQQIDIMPTVLDYLNYDKPYIAFGHNLLDENYKQHEAIGFSNQMFHYFKGDTLSQFDGQKIASIFNLKNDPGLQKNLVNDVAEQKEKEKRIKAIVQQYIVRMSENNLTLSKSK